MKNPSLLKVFLIIVIITSTINLFFSYADITKKEVTYNEFLQEIDSGNIDNVSIQGNHIIAQSKDVDGIIIEYQTRKVEDPDLVNRLLKSGVTFEESYSKTELLFDILSITLSILPIIIIFAFYRKTSGKNGIMSTANSNAKEYKPSEQTVTFANVAGEDEAKESLAELVDFLHNPKKYNDIGAKLPKGALLVGPPGTGKHYLQKQWLEKLKSHFIRLQVPHLLRCM